MTPEEEKTPGADDTTVAVEDDKTTQAAAADGVGDQGSSPEGGAAADQQKEGTAAGSPQDQDAAAGSVKKAEFQEASATPVKDKAANMDLLFDVVVPVSVELGRTTLTVKDILSTYQGSVIELDRVAGEPVDVLVGGKPLARGEVVVVKDRFGVRITEILGSVEGVGEA
jgi:flagellar motor switch protein FliN/FliY